MLITSPLLWRPTELAPIRDRSTDAPRNYNSEEPAKRAATVKKVLANAIDGLIQKFEMVSSKSELFIDY